MKKLILGAFLIFGVLGFSRDVEECEVTDVSYGYARCRSLETGKTFTFTSGYYDDLSEDSVYTVYFSGNGYNNLYLYDFEFLY